MKILLLLVDIRELQRLCKKTFVNYLRQDAIPKNTSRKLERIQYHPFHTDRLTRVSVLKFEVKSGSNPGRTQINPSCNPGSNPACEVGSTHIYPG